ncbi:MAG: peptidoglycan editing factor PgeF [Acidobacteriota bacterium]|nr:peptidoglycan editing factor PgeF [Acidobacteriota bacterium]
MTLPAPDPAFHWSHEPWGPALRCDGLATAAQHLFTSRQLQLRVNETGWAAATASLGAAPERVMRVKQVHGNVVRVLKRGEVTPASSGERPDGDAIVSNEPGLVLAVMVADCVPILLADRKGGAAAAVHAGWRGTSARVAPAAVERLTTEFGTRPDDVIAAIGPSIGPDDYEVGESLVDAFKNAGHSPQDLAQWFVRRASRLLLDLWLANRDQLVAAGVSPDRIFTSRLSTRAHTEVFDSFRAEGEGAGRMAALIQVPHQVES